MSDTDAKRFYWLKLKKDFFQQHQIKVLKSLPNGRLYALIYMELLAESTSHNGELRYSEMLPYDILTLSAVIDEDKDNVEKAIETLINLELVEVLDDQTIFMRGIEKLIGSETGIAKRQREYRERLKSEPKILADTMYPQCIPEIRDKSIDIKKESTTNVVDKKEKHKYGVYKHVLLTDEEVEKLESVYGKNYAHDLITFLDEYIEMKGYKAKSHYLCIRKWVADALERERATRKYQERKAVPDIKQEYDASLNTDEDMSTIEQFLQEREKL